LNKYTENMSLFKALADRTRLEILDMLSCGELCACMILARFHITQPTLSHHMRILCDSELVSGRRQGKWTYYSLNSKTVEKCKNFLNEITSSKENCECNDIECCQGVCS